MFYWDGAEGTSSVACLTGVTPQRPLPIANASEHPCLKPSSLPTTVSALCIVSLCPGLDFWFVLACQICAFGHFGALPFHPCYLRSVAAAILSFDPSSPSGCTVCAFFELWKSRRSVSLVAWSAVRPCNTTSPGPKKKKKKKKKKTLRGNRAS
eukprot:NODE_7876_length_573_cov_56.414798_g7853_i0.p1 GENE.NODE_7876_length_573_cov_56.414798_g7853_i0~~NODE_7876_length_573_cov_56.414798_g7853_i0.p1  ORF type:complete len:153 (-),score=1.14 NODE_7876_length_573_cov_56.414798_g7853_i0:4-462(-)